MTFPTDLVQGNASGDLGTFRERTKPSRTESKRRSEADFIRAPCKCTPWKVPTGRSNPRPSAGFTCGFLDHTLYETHQQLPQMESSLTDAAVHPPAVAAHPLFKAGATATHPPRSFDKCTSVKTSCYAGAEYSGCPANPLQTHRLRASQRSARCTHQDFTTSCQSTQPLPLVRQGWRMDRSFRAVCKG